MVEKTYCDVCGSEISDPKPRNKKNIRNGTNKTIYLIDLCDKHNKEFLAFIEQFLHTSGGTEP